MQALLDAIAAAPDLPADAGRLFHGRGGRFPGCEHLALDVYPPVLLLTSFQPLADEALAAVQTLAREEGIIPALESAHAFAFGFRLAAAMSPDKIVVINASGRGEKDLFITMRHFQEDSLLAYAKHLLGAGSEVLAHV